MWKKTLLNAVTEKSQAGNWPDTWCTSLRACWNSWELFIIWEMVLKAVYVILMLIFFLAVARWSVPRRETPNLPCKFSPCGDPLQEGAAEGKQHLFPPQTLDLKSTHPWLVFPTMLVSLLIIRCMIVFGSCGNQKSRFNLFVFDATI